MKKRMAAAVLAGVATVGLASPAQAATTWQTYVKMSWGASLEYSGTYQKAVNTGNQWQRKGYETCVVPDYKYLDCIAQFGL